MQLAATPLLQFAIDAHSSLLDSEFGFATGADKTQPFKELIETQLARLFRALGIASERLPVPGTRCWRLVGGGCGRVGVPAAFPIRAWGWGEGQNSADSLP